MDGIKFNKKQKGKNMGQIVSDVTDILDYNQEKEKAKSARKEILSQMAADEVEKENLVKKTLATQRAKYGASGMTGRGLTEETVLKRIQNDTESPFEARYQSNLKKLHNIKPIKKNILKNLLKQFDSLVG